VLAEVADRTEFVAEFERARDAYLHLRTVEGEAVPEWLCRMADARCEYECAAVDLLRELRRHGPIVTPTHRFECVKGCVRITPLITLPPFGGR
jgi:hypothetical protein